MKTRIILTAALLLAGAARVQAQEAASGGQHDTVITATTGETIAAGTHSQRQTLSSSLFISEFDALVPIAGASQANQDVGIAFGPELGWLQSVGSRTGIGAAMYAIVGNSSQLGVKFKYRRWLSHRFSIDAGLGTVIASGNETRSGQIVGSLGLSWNDRLHLVLHYENFRTTEVRYGSPYTGQPPTEDTHRASALYAGVKVGRELGIVTTSIMTVGTVVLAIAFASASSGGGIM